MMENNWNLSNNAQPGIASATVSRTFMANVFSWMAGALAISAITAYIFGTDTSYLQYLLNLEVGKPTILGWIVMFAPLGLVMLMGFGFQKLSSTALIGVFLLYAVLTGMSLSFIFLAYTQASIAGVFGATAGMFGLMALVGYTTNTDLTKLGSILMMALIGIVVASLINMFLKSDKMGYIISIISVIVFTGLTAYDVQKLKNIGSQVQDGTEESTKISIMGALTLYMDFINLFLALLRLFGNRRD
ncbi:MAG: hypothetical protein RIQ89_1750 [Bacteroidota bacterium]|jgi:uncharacterized protein